MNHLRIASPAIILLCFALLLPTPAFALKEMSALLPRKDVLQAAVEIARDEKFDPSVRQQAITFLQQAMQQERDQLISTRRLLAFDYFESVVIFSLAHLLVMIAVAAAISEFRSSRKLRRKTEPPQNELELGTEKLALKTSSVALLYLIAALAFYFMYIRFVYPIQVVGTGA